MAAVLHVDPDDESAAAVADELEAAGLSTVQRANTVAEALSALDGQSVDGVITEYDLSDGTGLELLNRVREAAPDTVCVLYTATGADDIPTEDAAQVVATSRRPRRRIASPTWWRRPSSCGATPPTRCPRTRETGWRRCRRSTSTPTGSRRPSTG
ncbi:MAG: response regulator [Halobacteriales archaeon]|nr:response regulator [Halobacteriales archaeon]